MANAKPHNQSTLETPQSYYQFSEIMNNPYFSFTILSILKFIFYILLYKLYILIKKFYIDKFKNSYAKPNVLPIPGTPQ